MRQWPMTLENTCHQNSVHIDFVVEVVRVAGSCYYPCSFFFFRDFLGTVFKSFFVPTCQVKVWTL